MHLGSELTPLPSALSTANFVHKEGLLTLDFLCLKLTVLSLMSDYISHLKCKTHLMSYLNVRVSSLKKCFWMQKLIMTLIICAIVIRSLSVPLLVAAFNSSWSLFAVSQLVSYKTAWWKRPGGHLPFITYFSGLVASSFKPGAPQPCLHSSLCSLWWFRARAQSSSWLDRMPVKLQCLRPEFKLLGHRACSHANIRSCNNCAPANQPCQHGYPSVMHHFLN